MNFSFLFQFWVVVIAGRVNEYQHAVIAYKDEEIRCLREQLRAATGTNRLRFTDEQRVRLAAKAVKLGRTRLRKINPLVTPDTLLRWNRKLIARKYDSSHIDKRAPGRPRLAKAVREQPCVPPSKIGRGAMSVSLVS